MIPRDREIPEGSRYSKANHEVLRLRSGNGFRMKIVPREATKSEAGTGVWRRTGWIKS